MLVPISQQIYYDKYHKQNASTLTLKSILLINKFGQGGKKDWKENLTEGYLSKGCTKSKSHSDYLANHGIYTADKCDHEQKTERADEICILEIGTKHVFWPKVESPMHGD